MSAQKKACEVGQLPAAPKETASAELELKIKFWSNEFLKAYADYEDHGLPADREAALQFLHMRDEAIKSRSPAAQARRHAAFERRIDEGNDYFQTLGLSKQEGTANA